MIISSGQVMPIQHDPPPHRSQHPGYRPQEQVLAAPFHAGQANHFAAANVQGRSPNV